MSSQIIEITSLAYGGAGVGRLEDGRAAFVAGAFPGDTVEARIVESKERFARCVVDELQQAAPERVQPMCEYAASGICGGCPWALLDYAAQLHWKRQMLVDALTRIAKLGPERVERCVPDCVQSKRTWNYRNKVEFEVGQDVAGRFALGMHAAGGSFTPLASCQLIHEKCVNAPKALTGALRYVQGQDSLGIERVGIRVSRRTRDVEVALWTSPGAFPRANAAKVVSSSLKGPGPVAVARVLVKGDAKKRKVVGVESLAGRGFWTENLGGFDLALSAPSFFQVNTAQAEKLVQLVLDALEPTERDSVMDLYSGAGTFTLPLTVQAGEVFAVEIEGSSVRDLRRNLERNGCEAEVLGGDVARELEGLPSSDKVVVDPPRSGLGAKVVEQLVAHGASRIAYVSCNPTTLARDIKQFEELGYKLEEATPVDLFPQSYHVETVALLKR